MRGLARSHGILDPFTVISAVRRFAQPSEVAEPGELMRAGVVMHARGLMNRTIQYNDDWVWPYWAQRQFDPYDDAFIPRAFSLTHINLTHRNWTAVGLPDFDRMPLVDPAGLVTPLGDGWSLDAWVVNDRGELLAPSRCKDPEQALLTDGQLAVRSRTGGKDMQLETLAQAREVAGRPVCCIDARACSKSGGYLALALRPYNPEGIHFIYRIEARADMRGWRVGDTYDVEFSERPERHAVSNYNKGDVSLLVPDRASGHEVRCKAGMATAAALFRLKPGEERQIETIVPLDARPQGELIPVGRHRHIEYHPGPDWDEATRNACRVGVPDALQQTLYDAAIRTLVLHSPDENVYPGPFTYKRFWFRDAAFILNAMLAANLPGRVRRVIDGFPKRQGMQGYYLSQEGEWDSNGEALWAVERYCQSTGTEPREEWLASLHRGARWIASKRRGAAKQGGPVGLFPAGFSAEHLGLNDYYYWDDFWGVAGLRAAAALLEGRGLASPDEDFRAEADAFLEAIEMHLGRDAKRLGRQAMPAAPGRRMDGGAIGSVVAGYPLAIFDPHDDRLLDTAAFLQENYFRDGAFFHHVGHSGFNAYLTLHIAQALMRAGKTDFAQPIEAVARLASPTGQWPEAVHPRTGGGCMGDGQHVWAAAEWVMALRDRFAFEEPQTGTLVLGAGITPEWLASRRPMRCGPTLTQWGRISLAFEPQGRGWKLRWKAEWHGKAPRLELRLPGRTARALEGDSGSVRIEEDEPCES